MTNKRLILCSVVVLFAFAAFSAGGCGSSSSSSSSDSGTTTATEIPAMIDVWDSPEFAQVQEELRQELIAEGIDPDAETGTDVQFVFIFGDQAFIGDELSDSNEVSGSVSASSVRNSALPASEIERIAGILKPKYESGDVIALFWPSAGTINDIYEALDEQPTYFTGLSEQEESSDTYPEIYAIAKRYGTSGVHYFSYEVPGSKALLREAILGELTSGDGTFEPEDDSDDDDNGESQTNTSGLRQEYIFQARRYANFVKWVALLDRRAAELDADAASVRSSFVHAAAESTSGNFLSCNSQNIDKDFSQYVAGYLPWNQERYKHDINYQSGLAMTVYAVHNFADGDDYYLVKQNAFSSPKNVWKGKNGGWEVCNFGHLTNFDVEVQVPEATASEVFTLQTAPKSVNREGSVTDGVSQTIGGKFGMNAGANSQGPTAGASAELSYSVTYSHSRTWETSEWRLDNDSGTTNTHWVAKFDESANYDNGEINEAGKHRVDIDSEWIWRVKKSYWSKHDKVQLKAWGTTWTGFTLWEYHWYKSNENESWSYGISQPRTFSINRPSHVYVSQKSFDFDKNGGTKSFKMLCNSDYEITSSASWCQISAEQRTGSDTGTNEREIWFSGDEFNDNSSTFKTRSAKITVKEKSTGDKQEITVTQRNR